MKALHIVALQCMKPEEQILHHKLHRPRIWFDSIDEGGRFRVRRIQVKPKSNLSLQKQHQRAEHWRLVNLGNIPLASTEMQLGSYRGEDYIVRLEDNYGWSQ